MPVLDRRGQRQPGGFTQAAFAYAAARDEYVCPAGARLRRVASVATSQVHQYRGAAGHVPTVCTQGTLHAGTAAAARRQLARRHAPGGRRARRHVRVHPRGTGAREGRGALRRTRTLRRSTPAAIASTPPGGRAVPACRDHAEPRATRCHTATVAPSSTVRAVVQPPSEAGNEAVAMLPFGRGVSSERQRWCSDRSRAQTRRGDRTTHPPARPPLACRKRSP